MLIDVNGASDVLPTGKGGLLPLVNEESESRDRCKRTEVATTTREMRIHGEDWESSALIYQVLRA